jgi:predicted SAM-dependent methyltransferase
MKQARKLHIGAGRVYLPGFINVDIFDTHHADLYCDLTSLPWEKATFDLIYASHVLEHVHRRQVTATLFAWGQMLRPGGILRLAVPDFSAVTKRYSDTGNLTELLGLLYGGQNHPKNNHFIVFDFMSLREHLLKAGFSKVHPWDWKKTEHTEFDDYSQCFLPHMDKDNGMLMSLNMEAVK